MKLIYQNFDGLDITFQGAMPESILRQLDEAKSRAQEEKREVLAELGAGRMPVMVAETGGHGGYRYRFDTGPDGEIWFIAHSVKRDGWNIRVSVKSLALALYGYEGVKARILERLNALQAKGIARHDASGAMMETPLERISRFDYCFDFVMDTGFMPVSNRFIAHQRCKKHRYIAQETYDCLTGDLTNTIRIGEMPGREATLYNKTKEILSSAKQYWWDLWGLDKKTFDGAIWRVEVRAGKDELDKWNLKRFADFEKMAGDVIVAILKAIRYTEPDGGTNRSRWPLHSLWQESIAASEAALAPYISGVCRHKIIADYRQALICRYRDFIIGMFISYTAALGRDIGEIADVIEGLKGEVSAMTPENKARLAAKFDKVTKRLIFLDSPI